MGAVFGNDASWRRTVGLTALAAVCFTMSSFTWASEENGEPPIVTATSSPAKKPATTLGTKPAKQDEGIAGKMEIGTGRYIASGIVGTAVGLGIGHAVQGTWRKMGWVFSLTEGLALTAEIAIMVDTYNKRSDATANPAMPGTYYGALACFVGLRIWEIVDIWTRPEHKNGKRYVEQAVPTDSLALGPALNREGKPGLSLALEHRF